MINERLGELYEAWNKLHPGEHLVGCGVVDEETYRSATPRIVLLNKEVNDPAHEAWDMVAPSGTGFLQKEVSKGLQGHDFYHTVKQAGIWLYGIRNRFPPLAASNRELNQLAAEGLRGAGWTNLKKSGGSGAASNKEIRRYAQNQFNLWTKELEIMDPGLILCGDTYLVVSELLSLERKTLLSVSSGSYQYSMWQISSHDCLVIDFNHPGVRGRYSTWYELLQRVFHELKKRKLCFWESSFP